jgi:ubiquinone biosynthesis protein
VADERTRESTARSSRRVLTPVRLRQVLTRRGPTGIKLGQFLAVRPDIIPQEFADELLLLVDQAPPFPWTQAQQVLVEDLGAPPEELFEWISPRPIAAGSLAQAHEALTFEEQRVAIKIKRAGVEEQVERDLRRARWLTRALDAMGVVAVVTPTEIVDEFARWLAQELDFENELQNVALMWRVAAGDPLMHVPRPYPELSGRRVVTTELVEGVPFSVLLRLARAGQVDRIGEMGFDRVLLAEAFLTSVLRQIFEYQLFHADPHPGNVLALPGNVVGFVDFGLLDELDESVRAGLTGYIASVYALDVEAMYRGLMDFLIPGPSTDVEAFHDEFVVATRAWISERGTRRSAPSTRSPIARYLIEVIAAARRHDLRMPPRILSIYRALLTAETIADELGAGVDLEYVGRDFFGRLQVRRALDRIDSTTLLSFLATGLTVAQEAPAALHRILTDLAEEQFTLRVRTFESRGDRRRLDTRTKLVTAALIAVVVSLLLLATSQQSFAGRRELVVALIVLLVVTLAGTTLLWRRLR